MTSPPKSSESSSSRSSKSNDESHPKSSASSSSRLSESSDASQPKSSASSSSRSSESNDASHPKTSSSLNLQCFFIVLSCITLLSLLIFLLIHSTGCQCDLCFPEESPIFWNESLHIFPFVTLTSYLRAREEIHNTFNVTRPDPGTSCTPVYLYFLSRHSIRYEDIKDYADIKKTLLKFQKSLLAARKLDPTMTQGLTNWKMLIDDSAIDNISESGRFQTIVLVRILYQYFPALLDLENTDFEVGYTSDVRTEQTADIFTDAIVKIHQDKGLSQQEMNQTFPGSIKTVLEVHRQQSNITEPSKETLAKSPSVQFMLDQFNARYGLVGYNKANYTNFEQIYFMCLYEISHWEHSVWCHLFTVNELRMMSRLLDINEYMTLFVGLREAVGSSTMADLYQKVNSVVQNPNSEGRTNATLYFTHGRFLKPFSAYLDLYPPYPNISTLPNCLNFDRKWTSSTFIPFNANFIVVLYQCSGGEHKLMTLWNEVPVKIRGCSSELCDFEEFKQTYGY